MTLSKSVLVIGFIAALTFAAPAHAQHRGGGGGARGGAVARGGGGHVGGGGHFGGGIIGRPYGGGVRIVSPRIIGYGAYRPYYYYRPGISIGFYAGFGYPYYYPYYYPYAYSYPYPYSYGYGSYGYPYTYTSPYPTYPYSNNPGYAYPQQGYSYPQQQGYAYPQQQQGTYPPQQGTVTAQPQNSQSTTYGGVRIQGAAHDAQVYVDGYYAGLVEDFDGRDKHMNLAAGTHQIEIRQGNQQPVGFDVNVPPNQTITVRVP